jgi:hypothetical protein
MPARRLRKAQSIARQATDLALAAPQVVAHRVARMAISGPLPSARDRREFERMSAEKTAAFTQAWAAMFAQAARSNQSLASAWLQALMAPPGPKRASSAAALATQWQGAALSVLDKGMAPVRRKAVANARRLARTRLR